MKTNISQSTASVPVLGMSCAGCASSVESILSDQQGVIECSVNFANEKAKIIFDEKITTLEKLQKSVQEVGFDLLLEPKSDKIQEELKEAKYENLKKNTLWAGIFTLPVMVIGMFMMDMPYANWIMFALTTPVLVWFGRSFFINAYRNALHGKVNMDTLVALSTGIAFIFSVFNTFYPHYFHQQGIHAHVYYEAATVVIFFILIGKLLEERAKSNTSSAIKKLMSLQVKDVWVLTNGSEIKKAVEDVALNDIIVVKPGEKIALDGIVESGDSYIDESMISGEPVAIHKKSGDWVFAGTINQKGMLHFEVKKTGKETLLAKIIQRVQDAQGSKAPVEKLVDKIASIFVPTVIGLSVLTFIVWMIFGGENAFAHALLSSITVLVIACPCALGLATPTALIVGIGKGSENGILIKDAESLELAQKIEVVVLDKTGTITEGKPSVTDFKVFDEKSLPILLAIESKSEHPLAEAVVNYLKKDRKINAAQINNFQSITGKGVEAIAENEKYWVGNLNLMEGLVISIANDIIKEIKALQAAAKTVIIFANQKQVLAMLAISDEIKATSKEAIAALQNEGVEVRMLTGDNEATAKKIAESVGIKIYKAETLPADKAAYINALKAEGKVVAMVGDGINDSEALTLADVSIAMGQGSDIAMDVAHITLVSNDLRQIQKAIHLSKHTVKTIKQNLFWAFIYNLIGIPIAAGVLYPINGFMINPMIAGGAMALSSVSVVSNSLRLKGVKI